MAFYELSIIHLLDLTEQQKQRIERLKTWMYYSILAKTPTGTFDNVSHIRSCVTIAEKEIALMAAHCLPDGVQEGFKFEIYNQADQPHLVEVKYINKRCDFVVLKTVEKEFDSCPVGLGGVYSGIEYTVIVSFLIIIDVNFHF
jgi:hypothetical protein